MKRRKRPSANLSASVLTCALFALPFVGVLPASAQERIEVLPVGKLAQIDNPTPETWALGGYEIARARVTVVGLTPIMRTEVWDARLVEILWRWADQNMWGMKVEVMGDSVVIHVAGVNHGTYLLMQPTRQDALAVGTSVRALALQWGQSALRAFRLVVPWPPRFGL